MDEFERPCKIPRLSPAPTQQQEDAMGSDGEGQTLIDGL